MITTSFETFNNSVFKSKIIYKYNSEGNMTLKLTYNKFKNKEKWLKKRKVEITYNNTPDYTSYLLYKWDTLIHQWNLSQKYTTTYDSINNKTIDESWGWDINLNIVYYALTETDYNSFGMPITIKQFSNSDSSNSWNYISTKNLTYNSQMKLIQETNESINVQSSKLTKYQTTYNYISDTILHSNTTYSWDTLNLQWAKESKLIHSYDYYGKLIKITDYYYNSNEWKNFWMNTFTYDINNNLSFETVYWCDNITNLWTPQYKYERFYDNNYAFSDLILPTDYSNSDQDKINYFQHLVTKHRHYEYSTYLNKWEKNDEHIYYYSTQNNEKKDVIEQGEIRVYPNPTSNYIMIEADNTYNNSILYLYDIRGNVVLKHQLDINKKIPVYFLSQGIYLFSVQTSNKTFTGKITIAR